MPSLEEVHNRLRTKKKEASEIKKAFKDSLASNPRYQQVVETLKTLKEEKKSIENQAWAQSGQDAEKLDLLALDIAADKELLSDIALNLYVKGETVEIVDEHNNRWTPTFNANFKKDDDAPTEKREPIEVA